MIIKVFPPATSPYLFHSLTWKWPNDIATEGEVTIKMEKGIMVDGDVVEKGDGKPITGASVYFMPQRDNNEFFRESESSAYQWPFDLMYQTDKKGHFRMPVSPGPGYVLVKAATRDYVPVMVSAGETYFGKPGLHREYYDGALRMSLKPDQQPAPLKIELQRGVTLRRKVVRPDGGPAQGLAHCRSYMREYRLNTGGAAGFIENGVLELPGFEPAHSNPLFLIDEEHHCGATVSPTSSEDDLTSAPIQLQPTGAARFRFLNDKREPLTDYEPTLLLILTPGAPATWVYAAGQPLWSDSIYWRGNSTWPSGERPKTDAQGRAVVKDLIPGATYRIQFKDRAGVWSEGSEFTARSGETADVGDVTIPTHD